MLHQLECLSNFSSVSYAALVPPPILPPGGRSGNAAGAAASLRAEPSIDIASSTPKTSSMSSKPFETGFIGGVRTARRPQALETRRANLGEKKGKENNRNEHKVPTRRIIELQHRKKGKEGVGETKEERHRRRRRTPWPVDRCRKCRSRGSGSA